MKQALRTAAIASTALMSIAIAGCVPGIGVPQSSSGGQHSSAPTPSSKPVSKPKPTKKPKPSVTQTPVVTPSVAPTRSAPVSSTPTPTPSSTPSVASTTGPPSAPGATPSAAPTSTALRYPSELLDLTNWKLTLPINKAQEQKNLAGYTAAPYFGLSADKQGVAFQCSVAGETTSGSSYPRSELREMNGSSNASWSSTSGTHVLTATLAVTHLPVVKPQVVVGQIHDANDDVIEILATGTGNGTFRLGYRWGGKEQSVPLIGSVRLGEVFTYTISVSGGTFRVSANGQAPQTQSKALSGLYFKAGIYVQSNVGRGDQPTAYGEDVFTALGVTHS